MKNKKLKCSYCGKGGKLKWYIIADDLENPRPYHKKCYEKFRMEIVFSMPYLLHIGYKNFLKKLLDE
jgi:hypothetical protein